jgi:hypothetical protein
VSSRSFSLCVRQDETCAAAGSAARQFSKSAPISNLAGLRQPMVGCPSDHKRVRLSLGAPHAAKALYSQHHTFKSMVGHLGDGPRTADPHDQCARTFVFSHCNSGALSC